MARRILVVGGTGMLGEPVVEALAAAGAQVRVLARDPAAAARFPTVQVAAGDVRDPLALERALEGCDGVHVSLRGRSLEEIRAVEVAGAQAVAAAAPRAGVARVTLISGAGMREALSANPFVRAKLDAEAAVKAGGAPYTILRPTHFMESLPMFVRGARADVLGRQPHRLHYLAARDYAAVVARAFDLPQAANRTFTLLGPEALTMREALERYVAACRPGVKVGQAPLPVLKLVAALRGDAGLKHAARLFEAFALIGEGDPAERAEADALFGPARTTLAQWCAEQTAG